MESEEFNKKIGFLIDRWCEKRELEPLRHLLNAKASLNGLTDGWYDFLTELKSIRARYSGSLNDEEFNVLVELIHAADSALNRY